MILSASRRTDIPALYGPWLRNRLAAGEVLIPQPYRARRATRLVFSPSTVDVLVLWSKNPLPFLPLLEEIQAMGYGNILVQYTITGLGRDWEPGLPPLRERVGAFRRLAERLGPCHVDWRFDPILLAPGETPDQVAQRFQALCRELASSTTRCVLSFVDVYAHQKGLLQEPPQRLREETAARLGEVSARWGLPLFTCAEEGDYTPWGIQRGACLDKRRLEQLAGCPFRGRKDTGQRPACGCMESVDIGVYNTCVQGCKYCYATRGVAAARGHWRSHREDAPMLTGWPGEDWVIVSKAPPSLRQTQISLF